MAKENKKTLMPKLRFPEFKNRSGWGSTLLGAASIPVTERVGARKLTPVSISAGVGFVPQSEKFGRDISGNQYSLYTLVREGDFVYNKGNSLKFPQGCVYQLRGWEEVAAPNVFIAFRLKQDFVAEYFQYCFEKNLHGVQLTKHITSGARSNGLLNVSKDQFFGVSIPTPLPDEQQKIADCLKSLDELIAAQGDKVGALKTYKRGLMLQLFPRGGETVPRMRFPEFQHNPEWSENKFGSIIEVASGQVDPTKSPYTDLPHVGGENIESHTGEIIGVQTARQLQLISGKYLFDETHILYSKIRPALNKVAAPDFKGICSADIYPVRPCTPKLRRDYLFYLLISEQFLEYATKHSDRSKIPKINRNTLMSYTVLLPSPDEQQRLADFLSSLDTQIVAEADKLATLKIHKGALMQQLFPSLEM